MARYRSRCPKSLPSPSAVPEHVRRPRAGVLADGIVEDIITALSRFKSLFVIARNSSFTFKGRAVDIKEVGEGSACAMSLKGLCVRRRGKFASRPID